MTQAVCMTTMEGEEVLVRMSKTKGRGDIAPGKVQTNWRIDKRAVERLQELAPELGYSTAPAMVNIILLRVLNNPETFKAVLGTNLPPES